MVLKTGLLLFTLWVTLQVGITRQQSPSEQTVNRLNKKKFYGCDNYKGMTPREQSQYQHAQYRINDENEYRKKAAAKALRETPKQPRVESPGDHLVRKTASGNTLADTGDVPAPDTYKGYIRLYYQKPGSFLLYFHFLTQEQYKHYQITGKLPNEAELEQNRKAALELRHDAQSEAVATQVPDLKLEVQP